MTYEAVREFAGSWMLVAMFLFFAAAVLWVFRPGATRTYRDTANLIFRNEDAPDETPPEGPGPSSETRPEEGRA